MAFFYKYIIYEYNIKNIKYFQSFDKFFIFKLGFGDWGLGIGDWGLGIGDWANPQILIYK